MADGLQKTTTGNSLHEEEVKVQNGPIFKGVDSDRVQIYQAFILKDDEWKAHFTKKVLRKVDTRLLPLLILMYLLNFLDRSNLAQARLGGLEKDLGMVGSDFNLATSILFVVCITALFKTRRNSTNPCPGLYSHATSFQLVAHTGPTIHLSWILHDCLGSYLSRPSQCPLFRWSAGMPNSSRCR
jgi:hypothetical protein